jgi:hypothetical protein
MDNDSSRPLHSLSTHAARQFLARRAPRPSDAAISVALWVALLLGGASIASAQRPAIAMQRDTTPAAVVREYVAAFNTKQLDAMVAFVAEDVLWMSIADDSLTEVGRSAAAFRRLLDGYFRAVPSARSNLLDVAATGPWVTTHERTQWDAAASEVAGQSSVVVYEVRRGLIQRVWFYPALLHQRPNADFGARQ